MTVLKALGKPLQIEANDFAEPVDQAYGRAYEPELPEGRGVPPTGLLQVPQAWIYLWRYALCKQWLTHCK